MSSRTVQIVGGPERQHAWVDAVTNALLVKVVNPGGGGGGGVQYNEDTPHTSGDTGTMALVVRSDAGGSLVSADGDYAPLQVDATGALRVTGGGGGTQYQEDAAHNSGDTGTMALVVRKDAGGTLVSTDGDYAPLQVGALGALRTLLSDPASGADLSVLSIDAAGSGAEKGTAPLTRRSDAPSAAQVSAEGDWQNLLGDEFGRLWVKAVQYGTWTVDVNDGFVDANLYVGAAPVSNANPVPVSDGGGSLTVDGTVAATQGTSPWVVGQSTHANLNAQVRLQDRDGSDLLSVLVIDSAAVFPMADTGTVPLALVTDSPEAVGGNWSALRMNSAGALYVAINGGSVAVTQSTSPWVVGDGGGSLTVDGTVNVGNFPSVYPVNDNGGSLTVDGTVAVSSVGGTVTVGGTVAVSSVIPGTGATNLGKAEDAAHTTGDTGVMALAVRNDTDADLSSASGDYTPLQVNAIGRLKTQSIIESGDLSGFVMGVYHDGDTFSRPYGPVTLFEMTDAPSTGTIGTFSHAFLDSNTGGLLVHVVNTLFSVNLDSSRLEDSAHVTGHTGQFVLAVRNDTPSALAGTNGDYIPFTTDNTGRLYVNCNTHDVGTVTTVSAVTTLNALIPGTGATNLGKAEDAVHASGDTGVFILSVRKDTATQLAGTDGDYAPLITDASGRLHVNVGNTTLAVTQSGTWNIGTVTTVSSVSAVIAGTGATNLGKAEDAVHASGDTGVMLLAVRNDTPSSLASANGDYIPLTTSATGQLHVSVGTSISGLTPGTAKTDLGKAEDAAAADGDVGVMVLAVRRDTLASSTSANGDYATLSVTNNGALWTREFGVTTIALSGSTRGRPVQITGTSSGTANTIHTATTTSGELDRVYIWITNTSTSAVTVTIEFGTTGTGNELNIVVPAKETVLAVDGAVIGGAATDTIKAYAGTGSVLNAFGRVERLAA